MSAQRVEDGEQPTVAEGQTFAIALTRLTFHAAHFQGLLPSGFQGEAFSLAHCCNGKC